MMRRLTACLLLVLAAALLTGAPRKGSPPAAEPDLVTVIQRVGPGVLTIRVHRSGGWDGNDTVGAGVIVDAQGHAVTCSHVLRRAQSFQVQLGDGRRVKARVLADDPDRDLAVLKLEEGRYPSVSLCRCTPEVGEAVAAIGHPFGYTHTVTTGVISARERSIDMPSGAHLTGLLQTSVAVNPGCSGGPLLNRRGELVGINVAIREGAQGIAFAVRAEQVEKMVRRVLTEGK